MKYLILGAGPAGLTVGNQLRKLNKNSFILLEKEQTAGGLCRSKTVDNAPMDIGGGHFLDVRRPKVNEFLFSFMPKEEWSLFDRDSRIEVEEEVISHPIEANIWQLSIEKQVEYLKSISTAGCNIGLEKPEIFIDWISWKLGTKISNTYMLPYNTKMFGNYLESLGTYWLEKLPNVSFEETLFSCLTRKAYGKQPGHAQFYYPKKYGYGELWLRMANKIKENCVYNSDVISLDLTTNTVKTKNGENYKADIIISTIPWTCFDEIIGLPDEIVGSIHHLKHTTVITEYKQNNLNTDAQWIYVPDLNTDYHRKLIRHNFYQGSRGFWTETNLDRFDKSKFSDPNVFINDYAYPINTIGKREIMKKLLEFCYNKNVYGIGRWGEHEHYNSDVTVGKAIEFIEINYNSF